MARTMPQAGQGLGVSEPEGSRFPAIGVHQAHAQKAMQSVVNFADRLLDFLFKKQNNLKA